MNKLLYGTPKFAVLLFVCLFGSCSEEEGKSAATLEVKEQTVDFEEGSGMQTIDIVTNQENWSATVDQGGKNWCTVSTEINNDAHQLNISVTPNKGKEQRTTSITVKAADLSKKISVRQLGTDKGILISPMIMTVAAEGEKIKFKVTANVEYDIVPVDDWVTLPVNTRLAGYIEEEYEYIVRSNKGAERATSIIVKDKASDLSGELFITQKAFGDYSGGESGIKGDVLVPVSGGSGLNAKGQKSQMSTSSFDRAYDGDKSTGYHSGDKKTTSPDNWPLELTFEFKDQSQINYCVYYSAADKMIKGEVFVSTEETPAYTKLMDIDLPNGSATRIDFPKPILNPKGIRFKALETSGDFIVIKEMEFYRPNPDNFDPLTLFTDITCTQLKTGITEEQIDVCPNALFKNIAYYMLLDKYPRDFRIADYKAYPHPDDFKKANKISYAHNLLDNPTGIFVEKGKETIILVGETKGYSLSARILNLNVPGEDGFGTNYSYPLAEGINRFIPESDGLIYIYYHTPRHNTTHTIKIHIPTGKVNGYFDSTKHKPEDWNTLLNATVCPHFDVLGNYSHLILPVDKFKANTPDGAALIGVYDRLVDLEREFMGLKKYNRVELNRVCFSVMYNDSYMYATGYHTGYVFSTMDALTKLENL